ncbi:MAG: inorganic diphosphatase [Clostridiales bacterium]|nr:inorganic diphosphatase [Clostridiales bacterium]
MGNIWHDIRPSRIRPDAFVVVVEIEKGGKKKYELDKETGLLILDRILYTSTHYPSNYGFVPRTLADDGDPLDALLISSEVLLPLSIVRAFPIGAMTMLDQGRPDEKILCVSPDDPTYAGYRDIGELPTHIFSEMQHFFSVYKTLEGLQTVIDGELGDAAAARKIVEKCIRAYEEAFG